MKKLVCLTVLVVLLSGCKPSGVATPGDGSLTSAPAPEPVAATPPPAPEPPPPPPAPAGPVTDVLGKSVTGTEIKYTRWNGGPEKPVLLICGFHGDERLAYAFCNQVIDKIAADPTLLQGRHFIGIPLFNPDGRAKVTRGNQNGVDLNRNFPVGWLADAKGKRYNPGPAALSEPESKALMAFVQKEQPQLIITVHQPMKMIDYDGPEPAGEIGKLMGSRNGYRVSSSIGYPTPGSFGTWTSSINIPNICLEMPGGVEKDVDSVGKGNYEAMMAAILFKPGAVPADASPAASGAAPSPGETVALPPPGTAPVGTPK